MVDNDKVDTVTFTNSDGNIDVLHNVRYVSEDGSFLVVMHSDDAPADMGWYDAQELHGYEEQRTQIPLEKVERIDG